VPKPYFTAWMSKPRRKSLIITCSTVRDATCTAPTRQAVGAKTT